MKPNKPRVGGGELVLSDEQIAYLDGLLDLFEDLPDGAWQQCCEDSIRDCGEFSKFEPFDVWIAWCFQRKDRLT